MLMNQAEYLSIVSEIKERVRQAQYRATVNANQELVLLYYHIGQEINAHKVWGNHFIADLSRDLQSEFPSTKGYSERNLKYMAKFAALFTNEEIVQEALAQIPWYHVITLMDKVKDHASFVWYANQCRENGWTRNVLVHQIESNLYARQALPGKINNFAERLPSPQSELATQMMKDPYVFDFIPFKADIVERDLQRALVSHVTKMLLELGSGFAFMGNEYHLNVGGDDFYIDLLFYHVNLRCYIVIELKTGEFKPEYAGKLNFYLSAVDAQIKRPDDAPTIGLLLCKSKNNLVAEYSLRDMSKPIGVSEYIITHELPEALQSVLPSVEDLQSRIRQEDLIL